MKRVENAGEEGNEKAFEMLSDFWIDLSLHLHCIPPFCSFGSERLAAQLCLFVHHISSQHVFLHGAHDSFIALIAHHQLTTVSHTVQLTIEDEMHYFYLPGLMAFMYLGALLSEMRNS